MARRYDHSRDELREMIIRAARSLVSRDGVQALSTRKIAKEVGYTAGTIYHLFDNLDDLIVHLNGTTLDRLYDAMDSIPQKAGVEEKLTVFSDTYIEFTRAHLNLWNSLFDHRLPSGEDLPDWYKVKIDRLLAMIETTIVDAFEDIDKETASLSARVLWSSIHGICTLANGEKLDLVATQSAKKLSDQLIHNYLAGLMSKA